MRQGLQRLAMTMSMLLIVHVGGALATSCPEDPNAAACQAACPATPGLGVRRAPEIRPGFPQAEVWWMANKIPLQGARVNCDDVGFLDLCRIAMGRWSSVSDTLPQDDIVADEQAASPEYGVAWASPEFMFELPKTGHKLAAVSLGYDDVAYPCRITGTSMFVSFAPRDPNGSAVWWGGSDGTGNCSNSCYANERDVLVMLVHEFGHAYGLDHTQYSGSVMYPIVRNQSVYWYVDAKSRELIRRIYRDNFGPSYVRRFEVSEGSGSEVIITWEGSESSECRKLRLYRVDPDQSMRVVADSIASSVGVLVTREVTDQPAGSGIFTYYLSSVDISASGVVEERVIGDASIALESGLAPVPSSPVPASNAAISAGVSIYPKSVPDLLGALGRAWTVKSGELLEDCLADGFVDRIVSGEWWDRAIEVMWTREAWKCQSAGDTVKFRLVDFRGDAKRGSGVVECLYTNGCVGAASRWVGLMLMEFENLGTGWQLRGLLEMPSGVEAGTMWRDDGGSRPWSLGVAASRR